MTTETAKTQTLRHAAKDYKQRTFKQIQDFKAINIDIEIEEKKAVNGKGEEFIFQEASLYNEETDSIDSVRIPRSVIAQLNILLKDSPDMEYFRVIKSGEGMNTVYIVKEVDNL